MENKKCENRGFKKIIRNFNTFNKFLFCLSFILILFLFYHYSFAQVGTVKSHQKISDIEGNFTGILDDDDLFGVAVSLGDLDGDGISDLAIGAHRDDDGGLDKGAVWILFLNSDATVKSHQKISAIEGNFTGILTINNRFGVSLSSLGDFDGDGVNDLVVGALNDNDGGPLRGAIWILFLNSDGTVKSHQKISDTQGNFTGVLDDVDMFGISVSLLGDLNGDGISDIAVGAFLDDDGSLNRGAVWILFLNADGTVKNHQKISDTQGNFTGILDDQDRFGSEVMSLGDLDGDGITDIAVGAPQDDDGVPNSGAVWILFPNPDGTVKSHQKISLTEGNFTGVLDGADFFGSSLSTLKDLNGDGITDLAVGAFLDDDGAFNAGAIWVLFLNTDGTVISHQKISSISGNFSGILDAGDRFGVSVGSLGDFNGDGITDMVVGAQNDDDGGTNRGAVWFLFLEGVPICNSFEDLNNTILEALIDNQGVRNSLLSKAANAEQKFDQENLKAAGNILCALLNELKAQSGKHIDSTSAQNIKNCIITLADNLGIQLPCQNNNTPNTSNLRLINYPNPSSSYTTFTFSLPKTEFVSLKVYDMLGSHIATIFDGIAKKDNLYSIDFNVDNLPTGNYYYIISTLNEVNRGKIIIDR